MTKKNASLCYKFDRTLLNKLKTELRLTDDDTDTEHDPWDENMDEVDDALQLILGGHIESDVFNSGDWVAEMNERMKDPDNTPTILSHLLSESIKAGYEPEEIEPEITGDHAPAVACTDSLHYLQQGWIELENLYDWDGWRELINQIPNHLAKTPIDAFLHHVFSGQYPSPEIMLAIAKAFKLYLHAGGRLTLEEVFFGKSKKGGGSRAKRFHRETMFMIFHNTVRREKITSGISKEMGLSYRSKDSLEDIAERFLLNLELDENEYASNEPDVDSFLRAYRRWKDSNPDLADK